MKPSLKPPNFTRHYQANGHNYLVRQEENRLLCTPLGEINTGAELAHLGRLIADEGHLESLLGTAPIAQREAKYYALRPHLAFVPESYGAIEARRIERDFNRFTHSLK